MPIERACRWSCKSAHKLILLGTTEDLKTYFKQYAACRRDRFNQDGALPLCGCHCRSIVWARQTRSLLLSFILVVLDLVLVLVLIKDALTIKRMLTTKHPFTRDLFLYQSCKRSQYRKCVLSSPLASLLPRCPRTSFFHEN